MIFTRGKKTRERLSPPLDGDHHDEKAERDPKIPLSKLVKSPKNVRKTPPSAAADAELKASIAAHGILVNNTRMDKVC